MALIDDMTLLQERATKMGKLRTTGSMSNVDTERDAKIREEGQIS